MRQRTLWPVVASAVAALGLVACGGSQSGGEAPAGGAALPPVDESAVQASCPLFPAQAVFNTRIDDTARFPKHARSDAWVSSVGGTRPFHPDWGNDDQPASSNYYGIPFNVVDTTERPVEWASLQFVPDAAKDESDCAVADGAAWRMQRDCSGVTQPRFPVPTGTVLTEGGTCNDPATCGDHHLLVWEVGQCRLWEAYQGYRINGQWTAWSVAAWDLRSMAMRPAGWTSADAAGLPILPLLARVTEASSGEVKHALRVTFTDAVMHNEPVWPASHRAGTPLANGIPLGAALRLKAGVTIPANWTTQAKALALAMQRYGLYVADHGSNLFVQGEPHATWSDDTINQLKSLKMSDFEFVDMGAVTGHPQFSAQSYRAQW